MAQPPVSTAATLANQLAILAAIKDAKTTILAAEATTLAAVQDVKATTLADQTAALAALQATSVAILAAIKALPLIPAGGGGTTPPVTNYFPADPTSAPPSPSGSTIEFANGTIGGYPARPAPLYLVDKNHTIWSAQIVNGLMQVMTGIGVGAVVVFSSAIPTASPALVEMGSDGNVYIQDASGQWKVQGAVSGGSVGTWYNGGLPAGTGTGGTTPPPPATWLTTLPVPAVPAPGSGAVIQCADDLALNAAIKAANGGEKLVLAKGAYGKNPPPSITVPLRIDTSLSSFDATGQDANLAEGGAGFFVVDADCIFDNVASITGVGMQQTQGNLTSAFRQRVGCSLTLNNVNVHGCQCAVGGDGPADGGVTNVLIANNCDFSGNGLPVGQNTGSGLTHNIYHWGSVTLNSCTSAGATEGYALKAGLKTPGRLVITGGTLTGTALAPPLDIPYGSIQPFAISGCAITKPDGGNHVVLSYGEDGAAFGTAGGTISGGSLVALCPGPLMIGAAGATITIAPSVVQSGNLITGQGLTVVGAAIPPVTGGTPPPPAGTTIVSNIRNAPAWEAGTLALGQRMTNASLVYECTVPGASVTAPVGNGTSISTGVAVVKYSGKQDFPSLSAWVAANQGTLKNPIAAYLWNDQPGTAWTGATTISGIISSGTAGVTLTAAPGESACDHPDRPLGAPNPSNGVCLTQTASYATTLTIVTDYVTLTRLQVDNAVRNEGNNGVTITVDKTADISGNIFSSAGHHDGPPIVVQAGTAAEHKLIFENNVVAWTGAAYAPAPGISSRNLFCNATTADSRITNNTLIKVSDFPPVPVQPDGSGGFTGIGDFAIGGGGGAKFTLSNNAIFGMGNDTGYPPAGPASIDGLPDGHNATDRPNIGIAFTSVTVGNVVNVPYAASFNHTGRDGLDLRLPPTSPLRGIGTPVGAPAVDIFGKPRSTTAPSVGAVE